LKKITIQFKWVKNVYRKLIYNKSKIEKVFIQNKVVQTDNINDSGLAKYLPKTIQKQRNKIFDDKIMKNKEIIKNLFRKRLKIIDYYLVLYYTVKILQGIYFSFNVSLHEFR